MPDALSARFEMWLSRDLLAAVDRARGDVSRAAWIRQAMEEGLVRGVQVPAPPPRPQPKKPTKLCAGCGRELIPTQQRGRPQRWCAECKAQGLDSASWKPKRERTCPDCGKVHRRGGALCGRCSKARWAAEHPEKVDEYNAARRRAPETVTCPGCGGSFESNFKGRKYCSRRCSKYTRLGRAPMTLREASAKGAAVTKARAIERAREREVVALLDAARRLAEWTIVTPPLMLGRPTCAKCGLNVRAMGTAPWYHNACRRDERDRQRAQAPLEALPCWECGEEFVPRTKVQRYCSQRCSKRNSRRRDKKARDKRIRSVEPRVYVDHIRVARRDKWICHLCGERVTREDWSIDHLVPLSRGGAHNYRNVKLAHLRCNMLRGVHGEYEPSTLLVS